MRGSRAAREQIVALAPALVYLAGGLAGLGGVGVTWDEPLHREVGAGLLRYYATLGADDAVLGITNTRFYGGLFDLAGALLERALPGLPWHLPRHGVSVVCGALGIAFAARTAALLGGARAGLLAGLVLLLTGRWSGHALFDPKDVPFAAAYAAATFFLLRGAIELPRPRARTWLGFALATGCALGVRVAGLLLPALAAAVVVLHLALRLARRARARESAAAIRADAVRLGAAVALAGAAALALGVAAWPYLHHETLSRLLEVARVATDFPYPHPILFAGEVVPVTEPGMRYLPLWLAIALPPVLQLGALLGCGRALSVGRARPEPYAALTLSALVPLVAAIASAAPLYNGIRHVLFVLPPLSALAGLGWDAAIGARHRAARALAAAALAVGLLEPAPFLLGAHPYQYTYFSPASGGLARQSRLHQTDYWGVSVGPAARALDAAAARLPAGRTLRVASPARRNFARRFEPLLRHGDRIRFVEPDDPAATLAIVRGGPCFERPAQSNTDGGDPCFFVAAAVRGQRAFLVIEKRAGFERLFERDRRRPRAEAGIGSERAPSS